MRICLCCRVRLHDFWNHDLHKAFQLGFVAEKVRLVRGDDRVKFGDFAIPIRIEAQVVEIALEGLTSTGFQARQQPAFQKIGFVILKMNAGHFVDQIPQLFECLGRQSQVRARPFSSGCLCRPLTASPNPFR